MTANISSNSTIDQIFAKWNRPNTPGLAVGVVRDGEVVYKQGFGVANLEHRLPISAETVFNVGSVSKHFTAFAVLLLAHEGKLSREDDIRDYVPEMPAYGDTITISHLLYHTSGLGNYLNARQFAGWLPEDPCLPKDADKILFRQKELMFRPGDEHCYSNSGYVLLAKIVERVSGMPFPLFMRERVFEPVGMSNSNFLPDPRRICPHRAQGYRKTKDGEFQRAEDGIGAYGDGGLRTSIDDVVNWLQNFYSIKVGNSELLEELWTPDHLNSGETLQYACGLELECYRGLRAIRHGGIYEGFKAHIAHFPEQRLSIAIFGNEEDIMPWGLANRVANIYLEAEFPQPVVPRDDRASMRADNTLWDDFVGRYFTACGMLIEIRKADDELHFETWFTGSRNIIPQTEMTFLDTVDHQKITFMRDPAANVTHYRLEVEDGQCPRLCSYMRMGIKFEEKTLTSRQLSEFEGRYLSDELETIYTIVADGGRLIGKHLRWENWVLTPIRFLLPGQETDVFMGSYGSEKVTFTRSENGEVVAFYISGSHTSDLYFQRLSR